MARKATRRRRRRSTSRRSTRRSTARRGGFGRKLGGFINTSLLMSGAGVAAGLFAVPYLLQYAPASLLQNKYGVPLVKVGGGLLAASLLKRFNKPLAYSFAAGMIGSAALDVLAQVQSKGGSALPASLANAAVLSTVRGYGIYELPDGSQVNGYLTDAGDVVDGLGNVVGEVDLDGDADD